MTPLRLLPPTLFAVYSLLIPFARGGDVEVRITALGDSITRGVRAGVKAEETFSALLESALRKKNIKATVANAGIGGERTDQALKRLSRVLESRPGIVTIMYGTNDSYVDKGRTEPRLGVKEYTENLERLIKQIRQAKAQPILMTPPRWGKQARNGAGENPNVLLEKYVQACRAVAQRTKTPLVDHDAHWSKAEGAGTDIAGWTTDQCHPNPRGHREMAELMLPVVMSTLQKISR